MHFTSNFIWVWLAAMIGVFYFGEGINSHPVHHVSRALENGPYVPGQTFSRKTGIPNNATVEEASDRDYFAFTEANFRASGATERYEAWLNEVNATLGELKPGEEGPTEWQHFATEFWQDRDFLCGPLNQGNCDNMPTRAQIIAMYSENRTEARFVYYVTQVYQELHHYNVLFQMTIKEIMWLINTWIPYIIPAATFQQDEGDTQSCDTITAISKAFISVVVQLIGPITGGVLAPLQAAGGLLEDLAPIIKFGSQWNAKGTKGEMNSATLGLGAAINIADSMIGRLIAKDPLRAGGKPGFWDPASQNFLETGVSNNPFCQTFSGDYPDLNLQNEQAMAKLASRLLDDVVTEARIAFGDMYHGNFSIPSLTLRAMNTQNWDNIRERIDAAIDSRKANIAESIFLYALGEAASQDHTLMPCNLVPLGKGKCQESNPEDPKYKSNDYRDTVICPLPDRFNGRLMCSLGHLHEWTDNMLMEKTPLLDGIVGLRANTPFNYNIKQLGMMAFDHFLKDRNTSPKLSLSEFGNSPTGFHLPVFFFPQGMPLDFTNQKEGYNRNFLGISGDWTGDGTADAFERMNMGVGSPHRTPVFREEMIPATFSLNRPRLSPLGWVLPLCRMGYHWPRPGMVNYKNFIEENEDGPLPVCDHVLNKIKKNNYTMEQANDWFCDGIDSMDSWLHVGLGSPLKFRYKKQTERSIHQKCWDWRKRGNKGNGDKDREWYQDLGGNEIDLPASLIGEAADVCGVTQLDSGGTSKEQFEECVKNKVSSWYRGS